MTYRPEDWKPGDVAMVTLAKGHALGALTLRGMRAADYDGQHVWRLMRSGYTANDGSVTDARPLVVLDPEDDADVERAFATAATFCSNWHRKDLRKFLRALAEPPAPPKPDEPTAVGALVWARPAAGDAHLMWARDGGGSWVCLDGTATRLHWSYLTDVEVIR
jgi:hypothetical protein